MADNNASRTFLFTDIEGSTRKWEQHPQAILAISDTAAVLDRGTVVHTDSAENLLAQPEVLDRLLGVAR